MAADLPPEAYAAALATAMGPPRLVDVLSRCSPQEAWRRHGDPDVDVAEAWQQYQDQHEDTYAKAQEEVLPGLI